MEDLAYRRLIDTYYLSEMPFSGDIKSIAKEIGMADYLQEVEYVLNKYFEFWSTDLTWRNKRADEEIAKYHAKADSARNANRVKLEKKSELKTVLKSEAVQTLTKNQEPRTKNHNKDIPPPEGVDVSLWTDYLKIRKAKKLPLTETALKGLIREAEKAKMPFPEVIRICCEKGWAGFDSSWLTTLKAMPNNQNEKQWMFTDAGIVAKANELGVNSMGLSYQQLKEKCIFVMAQRAMQ